MSKVETLHIFRRAEPDPKPRDYAWWKDGVCRATCSCGWRADANSSCSAAASTLWRTEHRSVVTA